MIKYCGNTIYLQLPGDVIEIGVYKGGSLTRIAQAYHRINKTIYGIDTFEGMPMPDADIDLHKEGDFNDTDYDYLSKWYADEYSNIKLIKGKFPDISDQLPEDNKYCFVHVDVDIYQSVMDCCCYFYPRLVNQGYMIFDDYNFPTCPGAKKAVDDYFGTINEGYTGEALSTKQCLVQKIEA